ncbi:hypothetical protein MFMK1_002346 [Metallumcola ferriviriculae]|uniref:Uncharacterized protein n=1 Tax=Metallumcola ferriviriculae TaxID=3039180 RepID=A0AAU0UQE2_9FIRM|nr:hypothetical protein MFMK1_002346 [Desulfitibacteraceae bacterium MK1]
MCKFAQVISCCGETYYVLGERLKDGPFFAGSQDIDGRWYNSNGEWFKYLEISCVWQDNCRSCRIYIN